MTNEFYLFDTMQSYSLNTSFINNSPKIPYVVNNIKYKEKRLPHAVTLNIGKLVCALICEKSYL